MQVQRRKSGFKKSEIPNAESSPQLVLDYSTNHIYIFSSQIHCFDIRKKRYIEITDETTALPPYDRVNITPNRHCVTAVYTSNDRTNIQSFVSISGDAFDEIPHFLILRRKKNQWLWNTAFNNQTSFSPKMGFSTISLNINNNIHYVSYNGYFVYLPKRFQWIRNCPKLPINPYEHGLIRSNNRLIVLNGSDERGLIYLDLTADEMKGKFSERSDNEWQIALQKMPRGMTNFEAISISSDIALIVGGYNTHSLETMSTIVIFDATLINDTTQHCFIHLSKMHLPQQLSDVRCVVFDYDLHIVGGEDSDGNKVKTHYYIDLREIIPQKMHCRVWLTQTNNFKLLINKWSNRKHIPFELRDLIHQFCGAISR